jgi:S-adenosylmethionine:tRNA ribosyltransferase-isomerase
VITPERGVRVIDALVTGLHEPRSTHLAMLQAIGGEAQIGRAYQEALRERYLWHEFGDTHVLFTHCDPELAWTG